LVVAGGGGGTGGSGTCGSAGGHSGDSSVTGPGAGGAGSSSTCGGGFGGNGGFGGITGGAGGAGGAIGPCPGQAGALGQGGSTPLSCPSGLGSDGGGGGGGYYGGGAGGGDGIMRSGGGGGAGSSFWVAGATGTSMGLSFQTPSVVITPVLPSADLSITNSGAPNPVVSGQPLTYTITASNTGGQTATGVAVSDPLPESAHFNAVSTTQGSCTRSPGTTPKTQDGTVTCSVGSLDGGKSATITIVVTATTPGTLTNTATVSGTGLTSDADDSATAITTVLGR
jgi:uncharacterized repeat protein (TIGR01451 family)